MNGHGGAASQGGEQSVYSGQDRITSQVASHCESVWFICTGPSMAVDQTVPFDRSNGPGLEVGRLAGDLIAVRT